jgi:hypothetical protein
MQRAIIAVAKKVRTYANAIVAYGNMPLPFVFALWGENERQKSRNP